MAGRESGEGGGGGSQAGEAEGWEMNPTNLIACDAILAAYILNAYLRATGTALGGARALDVAKWGRESEHYNLRQCARLDVLVMNWARDHNREPNQAMMLDVIRHTEARG